jgi:hypothetical protein
MRLNNTISGNTCRFSRASLPTYLLYAGKLQAGIPLTLTEIQAEIHFNSLMRNIDSLSRCYLLTYRQQKRLPRKPGQPFFKTAVKYYFFVNLMFEMPLAVCV